MMMRAGLAVMIEKVGFEAYFINLHGLFGSKLDALQSVHMYG